MVWLFYTTHISIDPAHLEIVHAKVGKCGIKCHMRKAYLKTRVCKYLVGLKLWPIVWAISFFFTLSIRAQWMHRLTSAWDYGACTYRLLIHSSNAHSLLPSRGRTLTLGMPSSTYTLCINEKRMLRRDCVECARVWALAAPAEAVIWLPQFDKYCDPWRNRALRPLVGMRRSSKHILAREKYRLHAVILLIKSTNPGPKRITLSRKVSKVSRQRHARNALTTYESTKAHSVVAHVLFYAKTISTISSCAGPMYTFACKPY